jgi:hypothetical protein
MHSDQMSRADGEPCQQRCSIEGTPDVRLWIWTYVESMGAASHGELRAGTGVNAAQGDVAMCGTVVALD